MNAARSRAAEMIAKARVEREGLKWEKSSCSDENMVELEDEDADAKVELCCEPDIEVDVDCPVMTGAKSCGQAIIILFVRQ
jgi:hypothetical protein